MRNIVSPLDGFLSPFGRRDGNPFASLMSQLLSGASQLIAHPLEYGSMFQDRAGTTPVTAPGQLVGLVLDHGVTGSAPVLGPELVTNGTFDTDTFWTKGTGVTISGGVATATSLAAFSDFVKNETGTYTAGTFYEVSVDITAYTSGSIGFLWPAATSFFSGVGTYKFIVAATDSRIRLRTGDAFTGTIDNISIRELPGYHATAISDAARGVFREVDGIRYIEYNGVNTAYSTPALPAPLVDKAQVFAGVRKLASATYQTVVEFSPSIANDGSLNLQSPSTADGFSRMSSRGTVQQGNNQSSPVTPSTFIITGQADISGDFVSTRVGGINDAPETADQGTGNYNPSGTYPLYYGARAGTSLFFNGRHYDTLGPITRVSAANATAAQIEAAEAYYTARVI